MRGARLLGSEPPRPKITSLKSVLHDSPMTLNITVQFEPFSSRHGSNLTRISSHTSRGVAPLVLHTHL